MSPSRRIEGSTVRSFAALALCIGCTSILGIDGDYVSVDGSAGTGAGGRMGSGGRGQTDSGGGDATDSGPTNSAGSGGVSSAGGSGGQPSSGGSGQTGGASSGGQPATCDSPCPAGQKCCEGTCVAPSPLFGCMITGCDFCSTLPPNATGICNGDQCGFQCIQGFVESNGQCVPAGGGGTGGSPPPMCNPTMCPPCVTAIYAPCCQDNGVCGCAFPFAPCFPR